MNNLYRKAFDEGRAERAERELGTTPGKPDEATLQKRLDETQRIKRDLELCFLQAHEVLAHNFERTDLAEQPQGWTLVVAPYSKFEVYTDGIDEKVRLMSNVEDHIIHADFTTPAQRVEEELAKWVREVGGRL
jgi:hypothetical protein